MEVAGEDSREEEVFEDCCAEEPEEEFIQDQTIQSHITMHAMTGVHGFRTMRMSGTWMGKTIHVLIDCGSTNNFLDYDCAKNRAAS